MFVIFCSAPNLLVQIDWASGIALGVPTLRVKSLYNILQNWRFGTMVHKPFGSRHDGAQTVVAAMEVYLRLAIEVCHGGLSYAFWTPGRCHMAVLPQPQPQPRLRLGFGELDCKVHLVQLHFSRLGGLEIGLRPTWLDLVRLETESVSRPSSSVVLFMIC